MRTITTFGIALLCTAAACGKPKMDEDMASVPQDLRAPDDLRAPADLSTPPDQTIDACAGVPGQTHMVMVGMPSNRFMPETLMIARCDTVRWDWVAGSHNVVSGTVRDMPDNKFCSDPATPGDCKTSTRKPTPNSFSFKFTATGMYPYFCFPHFDLGMKGVINVTVN